MGAVAAAIGLVVVAYFTADPQPAIATAAVPAPPPAVELRPSAPSLPAAPTVKIANPFDPSETFEFPPGTTEDEAKDSAASLLLERARQRLSIAAEHGRSM